MPDGGPSVVVCLDQDDVTSSWWSALRRHSRPAPTHRLRHLVLVQEPRVPALTAARGSSFAGSPRPRLAPCYLENNPVAAISGEWIAGLAIGAGLSEARRFFMPKACAPASPRLVINSRHTAIARCLLRVRVPPDGMRIPSRSSKGRAASGGQYFFALRREPPPPPGLSGVGRLSQTRLLSFQLLFLSLKLRDTSGQLFDTLLRLPQ